MMESKKRVSVVMCTYNGAKYIREQMDSILNQTYPIYEFIIQDDNSTDETWEILQEYQGKYAFIKVFRNEAGRGVNPNFYSAMRRATGDFIAISDQDDIWEPRKIEWQVDTIGDNWLSAGMTRPFAEESEPSAKAYFDNRKPNIYLERMIYSAMIAGHTMMLKREFLDKLFALKNWIEDYMYDHFISIVAGAYEKISYVDKVLVNQRKHVDSATYTAPLNYKRSMVNIYRSVYRTYKQYRIIRSDMESYFRRTYDLLRSIPVDTKSKANAMKLAWHQSRSGLLSKARLMLLCVKLRNKIFYSSEKNKLFSLSRAIYFPISCSDYFRYFMPKVDGA